MKYLKEAVNLLQAGEVIIARTDTVYGLLADATNKTAVQRVFELKRRPFSKPLIVLVNSIDMAKDIAEISEYQEDFAEDLWLNKEQAVTLIFKNKSVSELVTGGGNTVAVRLSRNEFCLNLIEILGKPLVAPSANIFGHPTAITAEMAKSDFGNKIPLIIDGGTCDASPSTIVDLSNNDFTVLRGNFELMTPAKA